MPVGGVADTVVQGSGPCQKQQGPRSPTIEQD